MKGKLGFGRGVFAFSTFATRVDRPLLAAPSARNGTTGVVVGVFGSSGLDFSPCYIRCLDTN